MNKKKFIASILVITMILSLGVAFAESLGDTINVSFASVKKIIFNDKDVTPVENKLFVYEGITYIPLRESLELMGKKVDWDSKESVIRLKDEAEKVDSFTSASVKNFYEASSLKGEDLFQAIKERKCAISVATVNPDGSPNAAVVIPGMADEKTLMFGLADNQTKVNFKERKDAVVTAYIYNPESEEKLERNVGARLVTKYIDDEAKIEELMKKTEANEGTMFLEIVEILPLG